MTYTITKCKYPQCGLYEHIEELNFCPACVVYLQPHYLELMQSTVDQVKDYRHVQRIALVVAYVLKHWSYSNSCLEHAQWAELTLEKLLKQYSIQTDSELMKHLRNYCPNYMRDTTQEQTKCPSCGQEASFTGRGTLSNPPMLIYQCPCGKSVQRKELKWTRRRD